VPYSNADQAALDTETSRVQLLNALLGLRTGLVKLEADIVSKRKEIEALSGLRTTYAVASAAEVNTQDVRTACRHPPVAHRAVCATVEAHRRCAHAVPFMAMADGDTARVHSN
jgi:hypothetical protein